MKSIKLPQKHKHGDRLPGLLLSRIFPEVVGCDSGIVSENRCNWSKGGNVDGNVEMLRDNGGKPLNGVQSWLSREKRAFSCRRADGSRAKWKSQSAQTTGAVLFATTFLSPSFSLHFQFVYHSFVPLSCLFTFFFSFCFSFLFSSILPNFLSSANLHLRSSDT